MSQGMLVAGVILGLLVGFPAGMAYARAKSAWAYHGKIKASVPGLRKTAWSLIGSAIVWVAGVGVLVFAAVAWAAGGVKPILPTCPSAPPVANAAVPAAPAPAVSASPTCTVRR